MKIMKFTIKETIYGNFVYLGGTFVEKAIRESRMLEIKIPAGVAIVDPNEWKRNMSIKKKIFDYADEPVVLYGNWVHIKKKDEVVNNKKVKKKTAEEKGQLKLF